MRPRVHPPGIPTRLTRHTRRDGFTLPEILIVIVMISVLALVAIPRFSTANAKRHLESARLRVSAALVTARQAAIQKGQPVRFKIANNRVTVYVPGTTTNLLSPVPLDTLYNVTVDVKDSLTIDYSARGFASLENQMSITLTRPDVGTDSVVVSKFGMVQR